MSVSMLIPIPLPSEGHVHLLFGPPGTTSFYLSIPTAVITSLSLKPCKYLRYVGWVILGSLGSLKDDRGNPVDTEGAMIDQGVFHYILADNSDMFKNAVDIEVIKQRSEYSSDTSQNRTGFRDAVLERDGCCVFSGMAGGTAMHIVPYKRGDKWLEIILENRQHEDETFDTWEGINDIRNGVFASHSIHAGGFDPKELVILPTPNPVLGTTDIPPRQTRSLPPGVEYPSDERFTAQWIVPPDAITLNFFPSNSDATFLSSTNLPKPSHLLLHYTYGAAAVKHWGKNKSIFTNRPHTPRPPVPAKPHTRPSKVIPDRTRTIQKLDASRAKNENARGRASKGAMDAPEEETYDEDEIMLFLWGNSGPAVERYKKKQQERDEFIQSWQSSISSD